MATEAKVQDLKVIGTRPVRHDGPDKVTGRARYGADVNLPGLLYARVLRSPYAHARIKSIDTSKALALPGVKAVVTGADFPQPSGKVADLGEGSMINMKFLSNQAMASDKALYKGHAIAAVAAISLHEAEEALKLIEVDYEVLPFAINVRDAMKEDAPKIHERLANLANPGLRPGGLRDDSDDSESTNVANHFVYEIGDVEKGFKEADIIIEQEFETQPVHQGFIEPQSATAQWSPDGSLTVWGSSQGHFNIRDQLAGLLNLPRSKVKVTPMEIGGGFGAKLHVILEPVVAILSRKTGRPVKASLSRTEVFETSGPTSGSYMKVKIGATNEGKITAANAYLAYQAGAYPGSPVMGGTQNVFTPYDLENARAEGLDVITNMPKVLAYRAPGVGGAGFAVEQVMDQICEKLGMDPIEFRVLNGAKEGTRRITGPQLPKTGYPEILQTAKEHDHYKTPLKGPNQGRGVAVGFWGNTTGPASAVASVNSDGTVSLVEGSVDIGGTRAVAAMHVAEELGIAAEDVKPSVGDTDSIGYTKITGGSSVAFMTGWASYEAANDIKRQMIDRAARIWDVSSEDVTYSEGVVAHKSDPELKMTFKELSARLNATGGPVVGRASLSPAGQGPSFALHMVDVEVDPDTGKVDVLRYTTFQDVGKAIHPSYVEGQMQGGASQGIGWALTEEYYFNDQGQMANSSFLDYRMPTALDLPMIETVMIECHNPGHPYGARGVGEVPIVPPPGAIANAVYHATGVRMHKLPMAPGTILDAVWESKEGK